MQAKAGIDILSLLRFYEEEPKPRETIAHNITFLKCVRGGLQMAQAHRGSFNPRREYWRLPERRLPVAYLASRWTDRFAPPADLRKFASRLLTHFDQARTDGVISYVGVDYEKAGGLPKICDVLREHAQRLPTIPEWNALREVWPKIAPTPSEDVQEFLKRVSETDDWEPGFQRRLPWFGYLGSHSEAELLERQAFFFGYANLWTATNAYRYAGAQGFAPIIQNTPTDAMLDAALKWATGTDPVTTKFLTFGKDDPDEQPQDRSGHAPTIEVYGLLNLEHAPFYNNRADNYRKWFGIVGDVNAYELTAQVGKITAEWLSHHPAEIAHLAKLFREIAGGPAKTPVEFEGIDSSKVGRRFPSMTAELLDHQLVVELESAGHGELAKLTDRDTAAAMLHLLLDSKVFLNGAVPLPPPKPAPGPEPQPSTKLLGQQKTLPPALWRDGEHALAYLRAGFHVLFAGAPGTGKTTLAQFVGYAWDNQLEELPAQMPAADAPLTTVGNSAWSPFHTIGGLMPTESGSFKAHGGIFIDPESVSGGIWRLRNSAVVLDEMNRADLDRCIGELYPLLSGSAECISPAGLPGVNSITASPRFRVLATVNDARLDDIVFPISEGLARRFVRIELRGGSKDEVLAYLAKLGLDTVGNHSTRRDEAAEDAVKAFFDHVRDLLSPAEDDNRLPFGVAYFSLLKAWVDGKLRTALSDETESEQAKNLLVASLRTLGTAKVWSEALRTFLSKA